MARNKGEGREPKALDQPASKKTPLGLEGDDRDPPTFSFRYADDGGKWAWTDMSPDDSQEVAVFLATISRSTWAEIKRRRDYHHYQYVSDLVADAQNRFKRINDLCNFDQLFRFRLSGTKRLWGVLNARVFYVLWWDPDHTVYPSNR